MYIRQKQLENIHSLLEPQKAVIIYGPRRTGKTTLIHKLLEDWPEEYLFVNGEDIMVRKILSSESITELKSFIGACKLLVIDEAQKIRKVGLNLKLILDHIKGIKIIAIGSSSFDLSQEIGEPLTGRKYTLRLFPLAQLEISAIENKLETGANLESRLIYGSYPEIIINNDNHKRQLYLRELVNSYLLKDILELDNIKHSSKLVDLLQLLAFQIGKQVSCNELGSRLSLNKITVDKYLDLLEKAFVIYKMRGFSRNLRSEVSKTNRYYFYDNGIRNALINNFNLIAVRDDIGQLWENYVVTERMKKQEYLQMHSNNYFWRTYSKEEIDLVEEREGNLYGYEIKWGPKMSKAPRSWKLNYPEAVYEVVNRGNYLGFVN